MIKNLLLILLSVSLIGCFPENGSQFPTGEEATKPVEEGEIEGYWIKFYKIDNQVKIYLNNTEVFDSGKGAEKIEGDVAFGFTEKLQTGKNQLRIELYNDPPYEGFMGFDKHWEVFYELFKRDVPIDYIHEQADDGTNGMVWSQEHEIIVE